ncbi:MAG: 4Fe-4S binding protein [Sporomusaceae bacterium]|nr:4Fe-4S binding protein [Sporomusaceae bacterium]
MKKLAIMPNECMGCLSCETACSQAFYKVDDHTLACIQIKSKDGNAKPALCVQCGKCAKTCEAEAITQNPKGVYMLNKGKCVECGKCLEVCPFGVIVQKKGGKPSKCIACGICVKACPASALYIKED